MRRSLANFCWMVMAVLLVAFGYGFWDVGKDSTVLGFIGAAFTLGGLYVAYWRGTVEKGQAR